VKHPRKAVEEAMMALVTVRVPKKHMRRNAIENAIALMYCRRKLAF
jgi:hypothetical protein